ncbi:MAG: sodium-coupled permease [Candidatus Hydrogenedentota bacterium]
MSFENSFAAADYAILTGFFVVMLAIGLYYANRMKDLKDFFSGGRQVPWWVSGISLYMTTFSAFTFVAYSALAYQHGFVAITIWWFSVPSCLFSAYFLAARWRRAATTSPLEYIETRFGPALRQGFSWIGLPLIVIDDGLKLFVIGKMVTVSLGLQYDYSLHLAIAACGAIILVYTFLGGLWAVMITDVIQFVIVAVAVIVLVPLALGRVGGLSGFFEGLPEGFSTPTGGSYTWPWLIAFGVVLLLTYATKWPYVQRYYSVASDRDARKVGYLVAALMFFGPPLLFLPAMAARIFMPDITNYNDVYPLLCRELLPVGMLGVIIAAMFSATMSMLSSDYNAGASVITNDIVKRFFGKSFSDRALVLTGRVSTFLIGGLALGIALILASAQDKEDLVNYMAQLFGVLMPPVAIPMMAGLLTRKASNAGAMAAFITGTAFGVAAYVAGGNEDLSYLRSVTYLTWITAVPTTIVLVVVSTLAPNSPERRERIAQFLSGLTARDLSAKADLDEGGDASLAVRVIGLASAALGAIMIAAVLLTASARDGWISIAVGIFLLALGGLTAAFSRQIIHMKRTTTTESE